VALLWAWNLLLAAAATLPFWAWVHRASSVSPVTDVLLDGADIGVITSLLVADPAAAATLFAGVGAMALLALVSGAFLGGGILEVLTSDGDGRPLAHRFFRGAGHFFGRFFRLLVVAGITTLPVLGLVAAALAAATKPLSSGGSEPAGLWATLIVQAGVGLALGWFMLAHDYARAATVLTGTRSMLRTWLRSLAFVVRHAAGAGVIGLLAAVCVAVAIVVTVAYDIGASGRTWIAIVGTVAVHQAMMLVRTAVRVGQVSAQAAYWKELQVVVVERPAAEPVVEEAVKPLPIESPAAEISVQAPAAAGEVVDERE
jgi:hypothetical protein